MLPRESCTLDIAERGPNGTQEIARAMGVTRQRVEQLLASALAKLARERAARGLL
jgi:DNA-directed RNA polymerase sigma subunit (sigma70/sigma32)